MKRFLLGIIVLLMLIQPLASKALSNRSSLNLSNTHAKFDFNAAQKESNSLIVTNYVLDVEDEDECYNIENQSTDKALSIPEEIVIYTPKKTDGLLYKSHLILSPSPTNPLYILWGVYRV